MSAAVLELAEARAACSSDGCATGRPSEGTRVKCSVLADWMICLVHLALEVLNFKLLIENVQVSPTT